MSCQKEYISQKSEGTDSGACPYEFFTPLYGTWEGGIIIMCFLSGCWVLPVLVPIFFIIYMAIFGFSGKIFGFLVIFGSLLKIPLKRSDRLVRTIEELVAGIKHYFKNVETELDQEVRSSRIASGKYLFCFHPHGILSIGFSLNGCWNPKFRELTGNSRAISLISWALYNLPAFGQLCDIAGGYKGNVQAATGKNMQRLMALGHNISLIPGGFEEAAIMKRGEDSVFIKNRKGFVKYALKFGYNLVPIYTFGENETYSTFHWFSDLRLKISMWKIPAVIAFGLPAFPILPRKEASIYTVIGAPLELPKIDDPSDDDVNLWHCRYVKALVELFERNKVRCGLAPSAVLKVE